MSGDHIEEEEEGYDDSLEHLRDLQDQVVIIQPAPLVRADSSLFAALKRGTQPHRRPPKQISDSGGRGPDSAVAVFRRISSTTDGDKDDRERRRHRLRPGFATLECSRKLASRYTTTRKEARSRRSQGPRRRRGTKGRTGRYHLRQQPGHTAAAQQENPTRRRRPQARHRPTINQATTS